MLTARQRLILILAIVTLAIAWSVGLATSGGRVHGSGSTAGARPSKETGPMKLLTVFAVLAFLLASGTAFAQTSDPPRNPTLVEFDCPDHDRDTGHELKILQVTGTNRVLITTWSLGDPAAAPDGKIRVAINTQPLNFGEYVARATALAVVNGVTVRSNDSEESNLFVRAPGNPSRPIVR
jgi:hypothetical protein